MILGVIVGFGIPEAIVAAILTTAIVKALLKVKPLVEKNVSYYIIGRY